MSIFYALAAWSLICVALGWWVGYMTGRAYEIDHPTKDSAP